MPYINHFSPDKNPIYNWEIFILLKRDGNKKLREKFCRALKENTFVKIQAINRDILSSAQKL